MSAEDLEGKTWKELGCRWLLSQGVSTVLLFAILISIGYGGWYALQTAIPDHLKMIQQGFKDTEDRHEHVVQKIVDGHERTVNQLIESQDKERQVIVNLVKRIREQDAIANRKD